MGLRSLRKTFLGYKTDKEAGGRFASQRGREIIYNCKFSKVNTPSKREVRGLNSERSSSQV